MLVKKIFKNVDYPIDIEERNRIVDEYNKKLDAAIQSESKAKNTALSMMFEVIALLCVVMIFMYGDISIILKALYAAPILVFVFYDFYLLITSKKSESKKILYGKYVSQLFLFLAIIYSGAYIFSVVSLDNKFNTISAAALWCICTILSIGSFLEAVKNAPDKFLYKYLNSNKKYHSQPSWVLNITRVLILVVCILKPYMLLMGVTYILITPLVYVFTFTYYVYLQYDEVQNLKK